MCIYETQQYHCACAQPFMTTRTKSVSGSDVSLFFFLRALSVLSVLGVLRFLRFILNFLAQRLQALAGFFGSFVQLFSSARRSLINLLSGPLGRTFRVGISGLPVTSGKAEHDYSDSHQGDGRLVLFQHLLPLFRNIGRHVPAGHEVQHR